MFVGHLKRSYSLESVIVFIRHGDRGPLAHVKNISNVNCAGDIFNNDNSDFDRLFRTYENFLHNISVPGKMPSFLSQILGPFHGLPLLPINSNECQLGQLTPIGVAQLLKIGSILKKAYADRLGIGNGSLTNEDVTVYSTRYRRTFQSAFAFLFSFLAFEDFQKVIFRESQSLTFCFNDCACPAAERYRKKFTTESVKNLRSHPAVAQLIRTMAALVFEMPDKSISSDPHALRDALLAYACHRAAFPCKVVESFPYENCVRQEQVTGLFAYTEWEAHQYNKSINLKKSSILKSYGLLRDVVSHILRIISERKPKIVLYSGHDKTLHYLTTALGIISYNTISPQYASRLIFEIYKNINNAKANLIDAPIAKNYYFRVLFNGEDITKNIHFCKLNSSMSFYYNQNDYLKLSVNLNITNDKNKKRKLMAFLCPVESIIRFLHDNYFYSFNATNFKDACILHS